MVIEANDIVDVVSSYVRLDKKSSLNLFGLCPFHEEKTPSFSVSPGKQIFYCFGCQKGGNVI
ncbi:MAG TPA: CHC2 zinc finger domain-containing protein, partial [Clostridia bacterium]|nr:CHC2 zinc finger domain-containing protein [Clostridia bacterium]